MLRATFKAIYKESDMKKKVKKVSKKVEATPEPTADEKRAQYHRNAAAHGKAKIAKNFAHLK